MKTKLLLALLAGIVLLAACKESSFKADYAERLLDSASRDTASPKLVKTADMRLKVTNVQQCTEAVARLTELYGGMIVHNNLQSSIVAQQDMMISADSIRKLTVYNTVADITIKVPSTHEEDFMDKMSHLGIFTDNRKMDVEDRTLDYLADELRARNREGSARLRSHMKLTQKVADSILRLNDEAVDKRIGNLRTRQDVNYSTLTLALYQNNTLHKEIVANDHLSDYDTPLSVKTGLALQRGWSFFANVIVVLLHLWPFAILGGVLWYGISKYQKRKKRAVVAIPDVKK